MQNTTQTVERIKRSAIKVAGRVRGSVNGEASRHWASRPEDEKFLSLPELRDAAFADWSESVETVHDIRNCEVMSLPAEAIDNPEDGKRLWMRMAAR